MQLLHTVTLVLCLSTALSLSDIRQTAETTKNEIDNNSVIGREPPSNFNQDESNSYGVKTYGGPGGYIGSDQVQNNDIVPSTIAPEPQPEDVQPMPTTGCSGHLPEENFNNNNNNNNVENIGQPSGPQQYNPQNQGFGHHGHFPHHHPHHHRYFPHHHHPHFPYYPHHHPHHHRYFPHHHHPHFPHYPQNPWSPWRRNMQFVGPQQFYPHNQWSPWRRQMPFVMPPTGPQFQPQNGMHRPPLVIVKLLQPIILPVAKPFNPEGGERDPDSEEVDSPPRYVTNSFQKYLNSRPHRMALRRFGGQNMRSFEDKTNGLHLSGDKKDGLNIYGDNAHISIKLH